MKMRVKIDAKDLIFNEDKEDWELKDFRCGVVVSYTADRCPLFYMFVIISYDPNTGICKAIRPRIRVIDGQVQLGQDIRHSKYESKYECKCGPGYYTDTGCTCDSNEKNEELYACTFKEKKNKSYKVINVPLKNIDGIYVEHVSLEAVNSADDYGPSHSKFVDRVN